MATPAAKIIAALPGLSLPEHDPLRLIDSLRAGLPARALQTLKVRSGLPDGELAAMLQVGERTLTRLKAARPARLPADFSERLYAVAALYALAEDVLGEGDAARQWMREPQFAFAGQAPLTLLASEVGRAQVRALLQRIEHGQLA